MWKKKLSESRSRNWSEWYGQMHEKHIFGQSQTFWLIHSMALVKVIYRNTVTGSAWLSIVKTRYAITSLITDPM